MDRQKLVDQFFFECQLHSVKFVDKEKEKLRYSIIEENKLIHPPTNGYLLDSVYELEFLEVLDLSKTKVHTLNDKISKLKNLKKLFLASTNITKLPPQVGDLSELRYLNLNNTKISEIPEELFRNAKLESLIFSNTKISKLSNSISQLQELKLLDIKETNITHLPKIIDKLQMLDHIIINGEVFNREAEQILKSENLEIIEISNISNLIQFPIENVNIRIIEIFNGDNIAFDQSFENLRGLESLEINNSNLVNIRPLTINSNLDLLYFNNCQFLCDALDGPFTNLEKLKINGGILTNQPFKAENFPFVVELRITDYNSTMEWIMDQLPNFNYLHWLFIDGKGAKIPKKISELNHLQLLEIKNSNLEEVPKSLLDCSNLQMINFSGNRISKFPYFLAYHPKIRIIDLRQNKIPRLDKRILQFKDEVAVSIGYNPPQKLGKLLEYYDGFEE